MVTVLKLFLDVDVFTSLDQFYFYSTNNFSDWYTHHFRPAVLELFYSATQLTP